jgi:hypothetical protein
MSPLGRSESIESIARRKPDGGVYRGLRDWCTSRVRAATTDSVMSLDRSDEDLAKRKCVSDFGRAPHISTECVHLLRLQDYP